MKIDGFGAEQIFCRLVHSAKLQLVQFDSLALVKIALHFPIGVARMQKALALGSLKAYAPSQRNWKTANAREIIAAVNWRNVPAQEILDAVFGLDCCVNFRGWFLGIDITACSDRADDKIFYLKRGALRPLWDAIGVERIAIAHVTNATAEPDKLVEQLRAVLKGAEVVQI